MIKLSFSDDTSALKDKGINSLCVRYIIEYIERINVVYKNLNTPSYGAVFYVENEKDLLQHEKMGLSRPFTESVYDFTDRIIISDKSNTVVLLHSCFILTNDYAISVFIEESKLSQPILDYLLEDSTASCVDYSNT